MPLNVSLVSAEREVWTGEAGFVVARTLDGELGILPGHVPLLGVLAEGFTVKISDGVGASDAIEAAVHGGFLSVANDEVTILAEIAELAPEIDVARARTALDRASGASDDDAAAQAAASRARARLAAAGQTA